MNESCSSCVYFRQQGISRAKDPWGLCDKHRCKFGDEKQQKAVFRWGNAVCGEYKAREQVKHL